MDARVPCVTSRWPCSPSCPPAPGLSPVRHSWATMTEAIQSHVGSLSWGHRLALREKAVTYANAYGEFVEHHKVKVSWAFGPVGCPPYLRLCPREPGLRVEGCNQCAGVLVSDQSGTKGKVKFDLLFSRQPTKKDRKRFILLRSLSSRQERGRATWGSRETESTASPGGVN